ncbi:MAG: hypothetical protein EAZ97_04030 [Bacteroidetes bacterium]|nr:MAG: hypothetical protein EAZ97_04030 [Bacteroidota bacterium]
MFLTNSPNFYYEYVYKLVSTLFDLSYLWFVVKYLETKKRHPKWHIFLQTMVYLFVLLRFLPSSEFIKYLNNIRLQVTLFLYFVLGFWAWYKQNPFAIFFILADSVFLLGIIANIALDIFKISNDIFNFGDIGLILQQIFFAVGLATKINILNKEKQETQKLFVLQLEENQRIKDQINEELERKVKERTLEIKEKQIKIGEYNEELLQMNEEMKQTNEEIRSTLEFAENQTKIITNKNKHLTDSINYALRIQTALLPTEDEIQKHFPEMFILNKPKDIVSGDFYWFEDKKDVQILAVADCTGHGVPGALMSMLGVEILDKIVNEHHILDVRWILYALNIEIRKVLKSEQTKTHDGMDICIVSVDRKHGILEYAGAMNPFFFIQNHVFNQIRANKYPIGGRIMKEKQEREYEKHTIMFEKEDHFVFYLCSDGYQDQFGGEKGGKFMVKKLKELLFEIHEKELFEQKLILDSTFDLWKNNEEQVDDVLIMGIKI